MEEARKELGQKKIFLYTHSPEAVETVDSDEAVFSSMGIRRKDGTMMDPAKPLSFTFDELKAMVSNEKQLIATEAKVHQLSQEIGISQAGQQELIGLGWLNNTLLEQVYSLTSVGFQQTMAGLESIASYMADLGNYIQQRDISDIKAKTNKCIVDLKANIRRLESKKLDVTNSNIHECINEIYAFIKQQYEGLMNGTTDGYLSCSIISTLLTPFTILMRKYCVLYYYENGVSAGGCDEWVDLVDTIAGSHRYMEKVRYYIYLETDMPYRDKVRMCRARCRKNSFVAGYNSI